MIEVLVAMVVLSILVLMAANIFQSSSASWDIGTQKSDMNTAARAALDFMARELAGAVAGPVEKLGSGGAQHLTFRQEKRDDLRFLTLAQDPDSSKRALRGSYFWLENKTLNYFRETVALDCYDDEQWYNSPGSGASVGNLITNVLDLRFYVYTNETNLANEIVPGDSMTLVELPICVDIALEMMSTDDMIRYNDIAGAAEKAEFQARNSKLYTTRVYFPNRRGYGAH